MRKSGQNGTILILDVTEVLTGTQVHQDSQPDCIAQQGDFRWEMVPCINILVCLWQKLSFMLHRCTATIHSIITKHFTWEEHLEQMLCPTAAIVWSSTNSFVSRAKSGFTNIHTFTSFGFLWNQQTNFIFTSAELLKWPCFLFCGEHWHSHRIAPSLTKPWHLTSDPSTGATTPH